MIVTIKFVCLFTFHETSLTLCNSIQKCTTRLEYSLSGSTRLVNFFGHDQRHVLFVLFGIHQSFYLEFQNISISHCVYQGSTQNCVFFCLLGFHPKLFFLLFIRVPPQIVFSFVYQGSTPNCFCDHWVPPISKQIFFHCFWLSKLFQYCNF